uniref:Uncharacterized protein n=1 Tax=Arundo donax TaxID=35708 RepID=A0A0A9BXM6_ARUDO
MLSLSLLYRVHLPYEQFVGFINSPCISILINQIMASCNGLS